MDVRQSKYFIDRRGDDNCPQMSTDYSFSAGRYISSAAEDYLSTNVHSPQFFSARILLEGGRGECVEIDKYI